jgi:hypothetical protein
MTINNEKMENLILYICKKSPSPCSLGAVKLNKILYFSDFISYLKYGKSITNEVYVRETYGPVPKNMLCFLNKLKKEKNIRIQDKKYYGKIKKEYTPLKDANITLFNDNEIKLVDEIISEITNLHTASSISKIIHNNIWELAVNREEIPYYTIFVSNLGLIEKSDMEWAKQELERKNLQIA